MTRAEKLRFHLKMIIFEDAPKSKSFTAAELQEAMNNATEDQILRAWMRALTEPPILTPEEQKVSYGEAYSMAFDFVAPGQPGDDLHTRLRNVGPRTHLVGLLIWAIILIGGYVAYKILWPVISPVLFR